MQFNLQLLTDLSRLQEIYDLRVLAWEKSELNNIINTKTYPTGRSDSLDKTALHWVVENKGKIVGCSRFNFLTDLNKIPENFLQFSLPSERPFAMYSRLVVHPEYRGLGIAKMLDEPGMTYIKANEIAFTISRVTSSKRVQAMSKFGFKVIGKIQYQPENCQEIINSNALLVKLNEIIL